MFKENDSPAVQGTLQRFNHFHTYVRPFASCISAYFWVNSTLPSSTIKLRWTSLELVTSYEPEACFNSTATSNTPTSPASQGTSRCQWKGACWISSYLQMVVSTHHERHGGTIGGDQIVYIRMLPLKLNEVLSNKHLPLFSFALHAGKFNTSTKMWVPTSLRQKTLVCFAGHGVDPRKSLPVSCFLDT